MPETIDKEAAKKRLNELSHQEEVLSKEKQQMLDIINKKEPTKIDTILTYLDGCKDQNINPLTIDDFAFLPEEDRDSQLAYHELTIMYRSAMSDRIPDFDSGTEQHWWPRFEKTPSGFVFSDSLFDSWGTAARVGARLCVYTQHESDLLGKRWQTTWNRFLKR